MTPIFRPRCPPKLHEMLLRLSTLAPSQASGNGPRERIRGSAIDMLRAALVDAFENRCCYCETALGTSTLGEIERFRPRSGVASNDGKFENQQYTDLAFEWRNLYLSCPMCNRLKSNRFPLMGPPAALGSSYEEIIEFERPLLLDPCSDNPDEHLVFDSDGKVSGLTERGTATIQLLNLNRLALVSARREQVQIFGLGQAATLNQDSYPHPAVWRQLRRANEDPHQADQRSLMADARQAEHEATRSQISTETGVGLEEYRSVASFIESITIENVGPIARLELNPSESQSSSAPCFALLGDNGVGKSTVLKAIALAMSGEQYVKDLRISSNRLLPPNAYKGKVQIKTTDGREDIVMSLQRGRRIRFNLENSRALVVAYGATRLLPQGRHKPKPGRKHAKIDNLFNPFLPLADAAQWLEGLDEERLIEVNRVLSLLLADTQKMMLSLTGPKGALQVLLANDPPRTIYQLSDGYQCMLAMAVDILAVMYAAEFQSMKAAQGIVLIDEMGNHFHPGWRMRIVGALRQAFPSIQFIFSTHDPLCLRGLVQGEVAVLKRDKAGRVYAMENLPAVDRLRVDQLLTSEHFGLQSSVDPALQEEMDRYEQLVQLDHRNTEEEAELTELTQKLTDGRFLGATRRERMLLQLLEMEDIEAVVPVTGSVDAASLSESTVAKLSRILRVVSPTQGNRT